VIRDLTVRRQVERMKDEFLAGVSHELRTPLTSILGALGLIAGGAAGSLPGPAMALAEVARRNGERLGRLIDDLLDLTKLEGDRMVLHQRPAGVATLLREALAANQGYADRTQVQLRLLGADDDDPLVRLDPDRFAQIMANLLSNAIKHTPPQHSVTVTLEAPPGEVLIRVQDQGPGIAAEFLPRMFQKFSQADGSDTRAKGGTGLGLYLTRVLTERMKGQISAHNEGGAVLSVRFPRWAPV
jgi:signal transduction histidine kinase